MTIENLRRKLVCVAFMLATGLTGLAGEKAAQVEALDGTWIPLKAELGGQAMAEAVLKTITLKLDKGRYTVIVDGAPQPDTGTFTVDTAADPKAMKVNGVNGPNAGKTFPAIYELKPDSLRICYDLSGAKTPTQFKSSPGTKLYLVTYRRKGA